MSNEIIRGEPRRSGRQQLLDKTQGLLPTDLASRRIDAGEALELLAPVGLRDLPRRRTGKNLTGTEPGPSPVAVGQQPLVADPSCGWLTARGFSSSGTVKTTWKYGIGNSSARRCSSQRSFSRLWYFGQ